MTRLHPVSDASVNPSHLFHPSVAEWFERSFAAPTAAQAEAWPAIQAGQHTLIAAPTGSGKTLAAFLAAIDALIRQGVSGGLADETQIVYVSPLKALSNDIRRNLEAPLAGIREALKARLSGCRHHQLGAHRRHAGARARPHAREAAAYRRHNAAIAVYPPRLALRPRDA